jgi:hypothetical protein
VANGVCCLRRWPPHPRDAIKRVPTPVASNSPLVSYGKFSLQLRGHFQHWCGIDFSSLSTLCSRPWCLLVLIIVVIVNLTGKVHNVQPIKKPLHLRGQLHWLFPSSRGMLRRNWHPSCGIAGGLPGFIGPFPSTSLDESRIFCTYLIVRVLLIC